MGECSELGKHRTTVQVTAVQCWKVQGLVWMCDLVGVVVVRRAWQLWVAQKNRLVALSSALPQQ